MAGKFLSRKMMSAIRRLDRTNSEGRHITICGCGGETCFYLTRLPRTRDVSLEQSMVILEQMKHR